MNAVSSLLVFCLLIVGCSPASIEDQEFWIGKDGTIIESINELDSPVLVDDGVSYILEDGEMRHAEFPDTFEIPTSARRESLKVGQIAKLMFQITAEDVIQTERMWVTIQKRTDEGYIGVLSNNSFNSESIHAGMEVQFEPRHVIQIHVDKDAGSK